MKNYHLAILKKIYLDMILSGSKSLEARFSKTRKPPLNCVQPGDTIFLKQTSGPVLAKAKVKHVKTFTNLTPREILDIKKEYNHLIKADDDYWPAISASRYATLIWLTDLTKIPPRKINKTDMRAWVPLTKNQNFSLLKKPEKPN